MDIIKELGLNVLRVDASKPYEPDIRYEDVVLVSDLRAALEKLPAVYGSPDTPSDQLAWSSTQLDCDTHKALLLAVEPIKKKTKAEAALELLQEMLDDVNFDWQGSEHHFEDEAKRILEMKDEV